MYKQFETVQKQLLRELIRMYVRKYVSVVYWIEHPVPPNSMSASWLILDGLNQPQWDYIYRLFGKKVDKRMEAIRRIHTVLIIANTFADIMGIRMNPIAVQEPILGGVEDLYRFWGARLFRTEHWWYGKTDGFLVPIGQANPVQ